MRLFRAQAQGAQGPKHDTAELATIRGVLFLSLWRSTDKLAHLLLIPLVFV